MEVRDITAIIESPAPDAALHSPLTGKLVFTGHDQIGTVIKVVRETFGDLHYTGGLRSHDAAFLTC